MNNILSPKGLKWKEGVGKGISDLVMSKEASIPGTPKAISDLNIGFSGTEAIVEFFTDGGDFTVPELQNDEEVQRTVIRSAIAWDLVELTCKELYKRPSPGSLTEKGIIEKKLRLNDLEKTLGEKQSIGTREGTGNFQT